MAFVFKTKQKKYNKTNVKLLIKKNTYFHKQQRTIIFLYEENVF